MLENTEGESGTLANIRIAFETMFLLILGEFHTMYFNPIHSLLPILPRCSPTLVLPKLYILFSSLSP